MIIATAGHVDHGKTSLVRNLTGVETDRLEEEKRRGLSINLGYAYRPVDDDTVLGFIDVPGHSRFINTMISGISGIDLGMLVVAADDGPMPQTKEHLQVLELLGVERYLLVVTKIDMVDANRVDAVQSEMLAQLPADTQVFLVSNTSGEGIELLGQHLDALGTEVRERDSSGLFRMSVDRAFYVKGSGLVVTGTLSSGSVEVGDTLVLQPQGKSVRVRGIHAQNESSLRGSSGQRCALNIRGEVHRDEIERGDWLAHPDSLEPSSKFDTWLRILPDAPFGIKHMSQVKIHLGAKCFAARIALLQAGRSLTASEETLAQIITERPVLCCHGDKFLLRDYGETRTLGGGVVLDPQGAEHRRNSASRARYLNALKLGKLEQIVEKYVLGANEILNISDVIRGWNRVPDNTSLQTPSGVMEVEVDNRKYWLTEQKWKAIGTSLLSHLKQWHLVHPNEKGVTPALLEGACELGTARVLFLPALKELTRNREIVLSEGLLCTSDQQARLKTTDSAEWRKLQAMLAGAGKKIPSLPQLEEGGQFKPGELRKIIATGVREKRLLKISEKRVALPETLKVFVTVLAALDAEGTELTVINFRDRAACGRNLAVEILEYFDAARYTRRAGENRVIIDKEFIEKM